MAKRTRSPRGTDRSWKALLQQIRERTDILAGTLFSAYLPCNKGRCKCTRGELHGPTWRLGYQQDGRSSSVYVRHEELAEVQAAVRRYAELRTAVQEAGRRNLRAFLARGRGR